MNYLLVLFIVFSSVSYAQEDDEIELDLNHFRLSGIMIQDSRTSSYSTLPSWNPIFYRLGKSAFGVNTGLTVFEDQEKNNFLFLEFMLSWQYQFASNWRSELNLGGQTFEGQIGTHGAAGAMIHYNLKNKLQIDSIFMGYSHLQYSGDEINQFRLGLEFHF